MRYQNKTLSVEVLKTYFHSKYFPIFNNYSFLLHKILTSNKRFSQKDSISSQDASFKLAVRVSWSVKAEHTGLIQTMNNLEAHAKQFLNSFLITCCCSQQLQTFESLLNMFCFKSSILILTNKIKQDKHKVNPVENI